MPTRKTPIAAPWQLAHFHQEDLASADVLSGRARLDWIDAEVPGNVVLDLYRHGLVDDPFMGQNPEKIRPLETHEWWYRTEFTADLPTAGGRQNLYFEGIDTFSEIYLDGKLIATTDNMLIPHRIALPEPLQPGTRHTLHVRIKSDLFEVADRDFEGAVELVANEPSRIWIRKAGHAHGWNIFPRLLSAGLWGPVQLEFEPDYHIDDVFVFTKKFGRDVSRIMARVFLKTPKVYRTDLSVRIRVLDQGDPVYTETYRMQFPLVVFSFPLENPKLWWPRPYGDPNMYQAEVELLAGDEVLDSWSGRFGVRSVEIIQEHDPVEEHQTFYFQINGVPVSAYGTNHVPLDNFPALSAKREKEFFRLLDESNSNMIRVWGGGIYESSDFYAACDEMGVMVWHDFMYACALYPQAEEFLELVRRETAAVVRRLRNHPSIVLWCGDNEIETHLTHYFSPHQEGGNRAIANQILPEYLTRYDGTRPYWPSSPYTPIPGEPAHSVKAGDTHIWCHGLYYKAPIYSQDLSPFISEIGHLALNNRDSLARFIPEEVLWPYDRIIWGYRCGSLSDPSSYCYPDGRLIQNEMNVRNMFGAVPDNLDDFIIASQIVQAEAYKTWIERARRRKFSCGGILWWNLLDGCPQVSDAVVDYYYQKKLAFDVIRRVQEDILICLESIEGSLCLFVVSEKLSDCDVNYEVTLDGGVVRSGRIHVPANSSILAETIPADPAKAAFYLLRAQVNGSVYTNHYLAGAPLFDLEWLKRQYGTLSGAPSTLANV